VKNVHLTVALTALAVIVAGSNVLLWMKIIEVDSKLEDRYSVRPRPAYVAKAAAPIDALMCARADWCGVDFTRLAAHPEVLVGKRIFILGYLSVDHGVVSLFASEEDYVRMEAGRSLEIGGNRRNLSALVEAHGNKYVWIEGTYEFPHVGRGRSARLGSLIPPIVAREFQARSLEQGADDILVRVRYPDESNGTEAEPEGTEGLKKKEEIKPLP
jgi:hypothetical protein